MTSSNLPNLDMDLEDAVLTSPIEASSESDGLLANNEDDFETKKFNRSNNNAYILDGNNDDSFLIKRNTPSGNKVVSF